MGERYMGKVKRVAKTHCVGAKYFQTKDRNKE